MTIQNANFPSQRPTLSLDFAKTRQLDPRITFSRSSSGTYFDQNGVLQTALAGVARFDHEPTTGESLGLLVEEARTNILTYSEKFDYASWLKYSNSTGGGGGVTIEPNFGTAPNGTYTASRLTFNPNDSAQLYKQGIGVAGATYTLSFWIRADSSANFTLFFYDNVSGLQVETFSATTAWQRFTLTKTYGAGASDRRIGIQNATGSIYLWGAQLEAGSFPTSYIPTPATFTSRASTATYYDANGVIQTAGIDVARSNAYFPDENRVMKPAGLLLEAAGTNYRPKSTPAPSDIASLSSQVSLSTTTQTTPANTQDALLHESLFSFTGSTREYFQGYATIPITGKIVVSVFVKNISATKIRLQGDPSNQGYYSGINSVIDFTVSPPTITKSTAAGSGPLIEVGLISLPNGWYRAYQVIDLDIASVTPPNGITRASVPGFVNPVVGQQFLSWGYQIEASTYPTSYIPTSGSTVTRAADVSSSSTVTRSADVASITASPYLYGTFFAKYKQQPPSGLNRQIFSVGSSNAYSAFVCRTLSPSTANIVLPGIIDLVSTTNTETSGFNNIATTRVLGDYSLCLNGGTVAKSSNNTDQPINSVITFMYGTIGATSGGHLARFTYYPVRLPDATLQTITS